MSASLARPDYHARVRRDVFHLVPPGGTVLDIGGGHGATAAALKASGHVDRIGVADLVAPLDPAGIDFSYKGDLTDPDLLARIGREQGPFATILCLDILEHLPDPWAVVSQLHQLLAPGGCIVASLPNVRNFTVVLPLLLKGEWRYRNTGILDRTHLRFFGFREAVELLISSGLMLEACEASIPKAKRLIWANALTLGLLRGFLSLQTLVRVRRID